jgi:peptidoglycan/LPS O-acetylase OafA/YrhL
MPGAIAGLACRQQWGHFRVKYRRDIDGLRAIAVVPVVIYHIAQSYLRGGFTGVDIFFVISGFLISQRILEESREGRFSAADFWGRRFRRIVPAYAVMLAVVTGVVLWRYFPFETEAYGNSLIAAVLSVSNLYFWWTINYFNPAGETLPLLHTWSLAVEEQFYLFFPLLILVILRFAPRRLEHVVIALFTISVVLCVATVAFSPAVGFYWIFTRAWELLLGTLLALGVVPPLAQRWQRELGGALGLVMIGAAMLFYTPYMAFPGYLALLPCLGAALVIHSGARGDTLVARALSLGPMVFVGLISYSLYLWHWPLIAFQKADWLLVQSSSKLVERGAVLVASVIAATLSWWLIERPTRNRALVSTRALVIGFGLLLAALIAIAAAMIIGRGLPQRFSPEANRLAAYMDYDFDREMRVGQCLLSERMPFSQFDRRSCLPAVAGRPSYLLLGDSHAGALASGLIAGYPDANILQVTASGCLPIAAPQPLAPAQACDAVMRFGLSELPETRPLDGVWLFGRVGIGNIDQNVGNMVATADMLRRRGLRVTIIGPNPEYRVGLPRLLAKASSRGEPGFPQAFLAPEPMLADTRLKAAAAARGLRYVSLIDTLCDGETCASQAAPGVPLLFDNDHLTREGGSLIAGRIRPELIGK